MKKQIIEVVKIGDRFYFRRLKADNSIMTSSDGYNSRTECMKALDRAITDPIDKIEIVIRNNK